MLSATLKNDDVKQIERVSRSHSLTHANDGSRFDFAQGRLSTPLRFGRDDIFYVLRQKVMGVRRRVRERQKAWLLIEKIGGEKRWRGFSVDSERAYTFARQWDSVETSAEFWRDLLEPGGSDEDDDPNDSGGGGVGDVERVGAGAGTGRRNRL